MEILLLIGLLAAGALAATSGPSEAKPDVGKYYFPGVGWRSPEQAPAGIQPTHIYTSAGVTALNPPPPIAPAPFIQQPRPGDIQSFLAVPNVYNVDPSVIGTQSLYMQSFQPMQAGVQADPYNIPIQDLPGYEKAISSTNWLIALSNQHPAIFSKKQLIIIEDMKDLHKLGEGLAEIYPLWLANKQGKLSGIQQSLLNKMMDFYRTVHFGISDNLVENIAQNLSRYMGTTVQPEGIHYPGDIRQPGKEGRYGADLNRIRLALKRFVKGFYTATSYRLYEPGKGYVIEYAMMRIASNIMGAYLDPKGWQKQSQEIINKGFSLLKEGDKLLKTAAKADNLDDIEWYVKVATAIVDGINAIINIFTQTADFEKAAEKLADNMGEFLKDLNFNLKNLPSIQHELLIRDVSVPFFVGLPYKDKVLFRMFAHQEEWRVGRKIVTQLPVLYLEIPFDIPVHKDIFRVSYISSTGSKAFGK